MKLLLSACLLLITAVPSVAQSPDFSKVRSIINDRINNHNVPSVSIAVVKGNKIIWEESFGYADKEQQRKATIHTPYYLASISKTLTATAIMKLAEQKVINIDSPVNNYMHNIKLTSDMWDPNDATVKQVMTHTSGLTTYGAGCTNDSASCVANESTFINRYAVLVQPPGKNFDYSNLGYGILDKVIRDMSGNDFATYMQREIFQPLNMTNTYVMTGKVRDRATSYSGADHNPVTYQPYSYTAGASTIYGSVHDLALFAMMHLNTLKTSANVISKRSIDLMQDTIARVGENQHYGLGWWITDDYNGYKGVLAQGGTYAASAWMQLIPSEDIGVVVLTNIGYGESCRKVVNETLSALLPKFKQELLAAENATKKEAPVPAAVKVTPAKWEGVVRTYNGDLPVVFTLSGSAEGTVKLNSETIYPSKVNVRPDRLSFDIEGDLGLSDIGPGPYILKFYLTLDGGLLYGHVETQGTAQRPSTQQLSYWVKMKKVD